MSGFDQIINSLCLYIRNIRHAFIDRLNFTNIGINPHYMESRLTEEQFAQQLVDAGQTLTQFIGGK